MQEEVFQGSGGLKLFARSWRPTTPARGLVIIVHGFKSHSGLYAWTAEQLVEKGLAVHALDLRGHGKSEGERFYVEAFSDYTADLHAFVSMVKDREPGLPTFLLGHSAGGVVSCLYAVEHQAELAGLICESFAFEVPAPEVALSILKGLSHLLPHAHVLDLKDEDFSRDPAFVAAMKADPLIVHTAGASNTIAEMVRADERLKADFPKITLPLLILHGTADKATRPHGSQQFYEAAGSVDKEINLYEGHFHDLFNDLGKEEVLKDVADWITARLPAAPAS